MSYGNSLAVVLTAALLIGCGGEDGTETTSPPAVGGGSSAGGGGSGGHATGGAGGQGASPVTGELNTLVGPGQYAAVQVDWAAATSSQIDPSTSLSTAAEQAVTAAPAWIRGPLRLRLGMLTTELQDELAALINNPADPRIVDEVAFSIANTQEADMALADFDSSVFTENALALYEYDALLPYAELIDTGSAGDDDFHTTVRHHYVDDLGAAATTDLPRDIYYWWVVHPKLDFEDLVPVDPTTGQPAAAPTGVHWRRYVMESSTQSFDYRDHYLLREPNDLVGQIPSLSATAHLTEPDIYPLRLFVDESGNGLLVEVDLGGGTLLASTLDTAQSYAQGDTAFLVNLCTYGNTNLTLKFFHDIALVVDTLPWGTNVYSAALAELQLTPDIVTSADFATLDFALYDKVIVAADQDLSF